MKKYLGYLIVIILLSIVGYGYNQGYFTSIDELKQLVASVGIWGPTVFILVQILQVIFPIIPGTVGCLAGVVVFDPLVGFLYNYISIVTGSLIVFGIAKVYGKEVVFKLFPQKIANKYFKWINKKNFSKVFALAIFLPVGPDDLLCYIAGTTEMKWNEYVAIIILGKPLSIGLYSLGLVTIFNAI